MKHLFTHNQWFRASPLPLLGLSAILGMNAAPVNGAPFQIVDFLQRFSRALDLPGFSSLQRNGDHGCRKHNYSLTILHFFLPFKK